MDDQPAQTDQSQGAPPFPPAPDASATQSGVPGDTTTNPPPPQDPFAELTKSLNESQPVSTQSTEQGGGFSPSPSESTFPPTQDLQASIPPVETSAMPPTPELPDTPPPDMHMDAASQTPTPTDLSTTMPSFSPPPAPTPEPIPTPVPPPPPMPPTSGEVVISGGDSGSGSAPHRSSKVPLVIGIIIVLAVVVIGGIFGVSQLTKSPPQEVALQPTQAPVSPTPVAVVLSLEAPLEGEQFASASATIRGRTSPNTVVVSFSELDEFSTESDATGVFTGVVGLIPGANTITVASISISGDEKSLTRSVTFGATGSATRVATSSAESVSDKKFVSGLITGINDGKITILEKGSGENFSTIMASESASIKTRGNQAGTDVDLEVGRYVVAVGTRDEDGTLLAKLLHIISR